MKGKTAIIGDGQSITVFKAVGIEPFPVKDVLDAEKTLNKISKAYKVIFITDDIAAQINGAIKKFTSQSYPVIVSVPSKSGSNGYGEKNLIDAMEKALGINLFSANGK